MCSWHHLRNDHGLTPRAAIAQPPRELSHRSGIPQITSTFEPALPRWPRFPGSTVLLQGRLVNRKARGRCDYGRRERRDVTLGIDLRSPGGLLNLRHVVLPSAPAAP